MISKPTVSLAAALLLASLGTVSLSACDNEGPAEEAGEKVDEGVKDAERGVKDATD